jgi:ABC-type sugar transport system ATPase subunit
MIQAQQLAIGAGSFRLANINFNVPAGCYAVLMGRTGSGKTTLLETLCGLKPALAGRIVFFGTDVTALKPGDRGVGYVPQDGALFQTMTVREHLEFSLRVRHWPAHQIHARVAELAELVGVTDLLDRKPLGLSGGEAQRVALGRALAFRPHILCLDEPLSALDDDSRQPLLELLKRIPHETGVTALHVTHNRHEAEHLADYRLRIMEQEISEVASFLT